MSNAENKNFEVRLDDSVKVVPDSQTTKPEGTSANDNEGEKVAVPANESQEAAEAPPPPATPASCASQPGFLRFGATAVHGVSDLPQSCRGGNDRGRFQEEEQSVRHNAKHGVVWLTIVNGYSALKVFAVHLISMESLLSIALSVSLTVYVYFKTVRSSI